MHWIELNKLASSNDKSFCNGYTDREESENEKRRNEKGRSCHHCHSLFSPHSPTRVIQNRTVVPAEEAMSEQTNNHKMIVELWERPNEWKIQSP